MDNMKQLVHDFPQQLREALVIARKFQVSAVPDFDNVLICGLGGSGIGGTIMAQLIADECPYPIVTSKGYSIPAFVDERTLLIACSYSGNTEETLESLEEARERAAQVVCVSSGGKLSQLASEHGWPLISLPSGFPPRAAFGFSLIQLFKVASTYGLIRDGWQVFIERSIEALLRDQERISNAARQLAESVQHRLPVLYSADWLEGVTVRWRQQINENSKMLCWHHVYPEMNHNELVGWRAENHDLAVIFLMSNFDHDRIVRRMELTETVFRTYTPHVHHVTAKGDTRIEQALYLIHIGDWMSVHLAELRGSDAVEVKVIDWLKSELANY